MPRKRGHSFNLLVSAKKFENQKLIKIKIKIFLYFLFLVLIIFLTTYFIYQRVYQNRIFPGVKIGNFDVGGLKKDEAKLLLRPFLDDLERNGFVFRGKSPKGEKEIKIQSTFIALTDPDLSQRVLFFDLDETINQAYLLGRKGNLWQRLKDVYLAFQGREMIANSFQLNEEFFLEVLRGGFKDLEKVPQPASFYLTKTNEINFVPETDGFVFDYEKALEMRGLRVYTRRVRGS